MEIKWIADTIHSIYRVPCNMEGEPEFLFRFKKTGIPVELAYEVRSNGEMKSVTWKEGE